MVAVSGLRAGHEFRRPLLYPDHLLRTVRQRWEDWPIQLVPELQPLPVPDGRGRDSGFATDLRERRPRDAIPFPDPDHRVQPYLLIEILAADLDRIWHGDLLIDPRPT